MKHLQPRELEGTVAEALMDDGIEKTFDLALPPSRDLNGMAASGIARVREMGEAIRVAEARANAIEARARELVSAKSRLTEASAQIRALEERAQRAELRAEEAESWLRRLHEAIARELAPDRY